MGSLSVGSGRDLIATAAVIKLYSGQFSNPEAKQYGMAVSVQLKSLRLQTGETAPGHPFLNDLSAMLTSG